jgi:hypothetical protein
MKTEPAMPLPECHEGREAFKNFDAAMSKLLSVPRAVLLAREAEYKKHAAQNPNRRGPKPKIKRPSSGHAAKS